MDRKEHPKEGSYTNYLFEKGIYKIDVNEQNTIASRFYQHKGFKIVSRDAFDAAGKPYPVLHLEMK